VSTVHSIPRRLWLAAAALVAALALAASAGTQAASASTGSFTTLTPDAGTVSTLVGLGVTPSAAPGNRPEGSFNFPITNSFLNAIATKQIRHSGGLRLTSGATVVTLRNFTINTGLRPNVTGEILLNGSSLGRDTLLRADFSKARIWISGGYLRVGPVRGTLTSQASAALTQVFGAPATTGLPLGNLQINRKL
jgi:hypothetical protein